MREVTRENPRGVGQSSAVPTVSSEGICQQQVNPGRFRVQVNGAGSFMSLSSLFREENFTGAIPL